MQYRINRNVGLDWWTQQYDAAALRRQSAPAEGERFWKIPDSLPLALDPEDLPDSGDDGDPKRTDDLVDNRVAIDDDGLNEADDSAIIPTDDLVDGDDGLIQTDDVANDQRDGAPAVIEPIPEAEAG